MEVSLRSGHYFAHAVADVFVAATAGILAVAVLFPVFLVATAIKGIFGGAQRTRREPELRRHPPAVLLSGDARHV
jgi:hypothetical protein